MQKPKQIDQSVKARSSMRTVRVQSQSATVLFVRPNHLNVFYRSVTTFTRTNFPKMQFLSASPSLGGAMLEEVVKTGRGTYVQLSAPTHTRSHTRRLGNLLWISCACKTCINILLCLWYRCGVESAWSSFPVLSSYRSITLRWWRRRSGRRWRVILGKVEKSEWGVRDWFGS